MLNRIFTLSIIIVALLFSSCSLFSSAKLKHEGLFRIRENGKFGFIDKSGKVVIKPQFDSAEDFSEGLAQVSSSDKPGKYGYVDTTGKMVISPQFDKADSFSEGLALVEADGKDVFIDKTGKVVIKPDLTPREGFKKGLAVAGTVGSYGFINKSGKVSISAQFTFADSFYEGFAAVYSGGTFRLCPTEDGPTVAFTGGKWQYIDKDGDPMIKVPDTLSQPIYDHKFSNGLALIRAADTGKYGYLNQKGVIAIPAQFDFARPFSEGLALIATGGKPDDRYTYGGDCPSLTYYNGKYGFIDTEGKTVIKPQFDGAGIFSDGFAVVRVKDDFGYIDTSGNIVIKPQFKKALPFSDGLAYACTDKCGYIDTTGKFVWSESK